MMDFHILIVISCVFLASLFSLLFINKFFRRTTFEEVIAEKKALTEKIYGQHKTVAKKPKKLQQMKKELKREKKQRQKATEQPEDSDAQSEQPSAEEESLPQGLSKIHVEFEPVPEVLNYTPETAKNESHFEGKENLSTNSKPKSKKEKKPINKPVGILVNKNEPVITKEKINVEEHVNHFESKHPKDVIELKKHEKDKKEEKGQQHVSNKKEKGGVKKEKHVTSEKSATVVEPPVENLVLKESQHSISKDLKQQEEKVRQGSPKNHQQSNSNAIQGKSKHQNKKQQKESASTKELVHALDKLSGADTIGVSLLMNLFRRAELNRSEIQILIDYLLNKQQDMPNTHSEWSDDICQKLKRQLEEKERQLAEEQGSSLGIQAKLRELRSEINSERAQMAATIKSYTEKLNGKELEINGLNQELQSLNDKMTLERQQFQAKLLREKQAGSQDLLAQLQMMQNELAHKDKCIGELTCLVNASRQAVEESSQKNDIIQNQVQQIHVLEQQREELEQVSNNRIFELEKVKTLETEVGESKVEIRNLQNALESSKADLVQARKELENALSDLTLVRTVEIGERQKELQGLLARNDELAQQLAGINSKSQEQSKEQTSLQATLDAVKQQLNEKEHQLAELSMKNTQLLQERASSFAQSSQQHQELQALVETLKTDVAGKHKQLQEVEQSTANFSSREKELLQQLQEQREKNNDLRMKNWKLVEALQNVETTVKQNKMLSNSNANVVQQEQLLASAQKPSAVTDPTRDQQQIRDLFQRLYPEAVKSHTATALSISFDQWIEQVLATHIKQSLSKVNANNVTSNSNSNKGTQSNSNNSSSNNHVSSHNSHILNNSESTSNSNSRTNSADSDLNCNSNSSDDTVEVQKLHTQNAQLRAKIDELTKLVTKTSNTLSELEGRAREQDEHWRSIVRSKDEQIQSLQHSNGEQDI